MKPRPRAGGQVLRPDPVTRLVPVKLRVEVRGPEGPGLVRQPVEQVSPPQRPVRRDHLRGGLAPPPRHLRQLPELHPGPVLHGGVLEVDLEPVPDHEGRPGQGNDVLHKASKHT